MRSELGVLYRRPLQPRGHHERREEGRLEIHTPVHRGAARVRKQEEPVGTPRARDAGGLGALPALSYDQGLQNSFFFAEEPLITEDVDKSIVVTDRASLFNLLIGLDGYTISSGILSSSLNGTDIVAVPLESDERMELGCLQRHDRPLSALAMRYLELLQDYVSGYRRGTRD